MHSNIERKQNKKQPIEFFLSLSVLYCRAVECFGNSSSVWQCTDQHTHGSAAKKYRTPFDKHWDRCDMHKQTSDKLSSDVRCMLSSLCSVWLQLWGITYFTGPPVNAPLSRHQNLQRDTGERAVLLSHALSSGVVKSWAESCELSALSHSTGYNPDYKWI